MLAEMGSVVNNLLSETRAAVHTVFSDHQYVILGVGAAFFAAAAFVVVPVAAIPGNTVDYYFSVTPWWTYAFLALFTVGFGFLVPLQVYLLTHPSPRKREKAKGLAPLLSSAVSGLYATAACAGCVSSLLSFAGVGGTLFLLEYRPQLLAASVALLGLSVYYAARRINKNCVACRVSEEVVGRIEAQAQTNVQQPTVQAPSMPFVVAKPAGEEEPKEKAPADKLSYIQ